MRHQLRLYQWKDNECTHSQIRHHKTQVLYRNLYPVWMPNTLTQFFKALNEANVSLNDITAVAVTVGPGFSKALFGWYDSCLYLVQFLDVPFDPVNHLHGHVFSAKDEFKLEYPLLVCLASGGHTTLFTCHLNQNLT